ncbi:MAG: O-antigen ligase family protein [Gammaproteobacteria bacterium]|nr:O-antigen ligase family protein [Gammaproteobacteria bacterium]
MTSDRIRHSRETHVVGLTVLVLVIGSLIGVLVGAPPSPLITILAVAGLAVFLLILYRPDVGVVALVFMVYLNLSDVATEFHNAPSLVQIYVPALLAIVLIRRTLFGDRVGSAKQVVIALGAYGLFMSVSLLHASLPDIVSSALVIFLKNAALVCVLVLLITRGATLRAVVWALLVAGTLLSALACYRYFGGPFATDFGGLARATVNIDEGQITEFRITGPVSDSNVFAQIMIIIVPLAIDRLFHEKSLGLRCAAATALVLSTLAISLTFSRGGFVALVLMLLVMLVHRRPPLRHLLLLAVVVVGTFFVMPKEYTERIYTIGAMLPGRGATVESADLAVQGRLAEMSVAWQMFLDHPFVGVGVGHYEVYFQQYSMRMALMPRGQARKAHSLYLEIAAERGLLGLLMFAALVAVVVHNVRFSIKQLREAGLEQYVTMVQAISYALIGYFSAAVFLHMAYPRYLWLLVGMAFVLPNVVRGELAPNDNQRGDFALDGRA